MSRAMLRMCYECGLPLVAPLEEPDRQCCCLYVEELEYDHRDDRCGILVVLVVGIALLLSGACLGLLTMHS
jgi:hypothetical protein